METMKRKNLTEKQQKFLDVLFEEAEGDPTKAKKLAGYSPNVPTREITEALSDEIYELTKKYIATSATKAAYNMGKIARDPVGIGIKDQFLASKDILDRAGFKEANKVEVSSTSPLFILPEKDNG